MDIDDFKPDESLGFLIGRTHRTMTNLFNKKLAEENINVTHEQAIVMMRLWKNEGMTHQELANKIFKAKSSTTRLIDNMEKRHLVVRIPAKQDKRTKLIYLTKHGKTLLEQIFVLVFPLLNALSKGIETTDMVVFKRVITLIFNHANEQLKSL